MRKIRHYIHSLIFKEKNYTSANFISKRIIIIVIITISLVCLLTYFMALFNHFPLFASFFLLVSLPIYLVAYQTHLHGHYKIANYITILTVFLSLAIGGLFFSSEFVSTIIYGIITLAAGLLCGTNCAIIMGILSVFAYSIRVFVDIKGIIEHPAPAGLFYFNIIILALCLGLIILINWFSNQAMRYLLENERQMSKELQDNKEELEKRINKLEITENNSRQQAEQLSKLSLLIRGITELKSLGEVLTQVTQSSIDLLKGDAGGIYLYRSNENILEWVVSIGHNIEPIGMKLKPGLGIAGRVMITGEPIVIENNQKKDVNTKSNPAPASQILCVPIKWRKEILGVLNIRVDNRTRKKFSTKDILLALQFASQAAIAIKNSQLFDQAKEEIHERKQAEETLKQSEQKYRTLMENLGKGVCLLSHDYTIQFANPEASIILGEKKQNLLGKKIYNFIESDQVTTLHNNLISLREGKRTNFELKAKYNETESRFLEVTATLQANSQMNNPDVLIIFHDITERKHLEDRLRQAQKLEAVGNLAGGIAHDFNNILTAIMGYAEISIMNMDENDPYHKIMNGILNAGKKGSNLTKQLLAFSRKQIIKPQIIDINQLIRELNKMLCHLISEDITICLDLAENIHPVKADPSQIEQILINLVVNARDAINEKTGTSLDKRITIETVNVFFSEYYNTKDYSSDEISHIVIIVSDTGIGMDEAIREKIFDPFFTTKPIGEGTGLGLATIYGIVKQNKASINVYSEPGKGTTFKIYWPVTNETITTNDKRENTVFIQGNETILVVEDDFQVRQFVLSALETLGYKTIPANNGLDALQILQNNDQQIDLVLTDLIMPQMGGLELAEQAKKTGINTKFLFASGYTHNHILHNGLIPPNFKYIEKPYSLQDLANKIHLSLLTEEK